ncbi:glycosyltransferase family 39 protein [Streptomyces sp. NBC_00287]|uniref:glycosyltransferase family 39 protein n=1 Tax=Streptomyces sp. NBC_00287 TaxID=2975702 RepID=UPI002E283F53|nr:glycosyltransferase family 39 protein [Streptomyces sp. NBC_00287]
MTAQTTRLPDDRNGLPRARPLRPPSGRSTSVAVTLIPAAVMLALGAWQLDRGMWWDEITTYEASTRSLGDLWRLLHTVDGVHGLYYLLMHSFLPRGEGDAVLLRLPSVVGMALAVAGTAAIGRRLAGPAVGVLAGLVLAVSPLASHYAQEGRSYALVTAAVVLASLLFLRALERPSLARWAGYVAFLLLATALHLFAVLVLLAHGVCLLVIRSPRKIACRWMAAALVVSAVVLPYALSVRRQAGQVSRLEPPTWKNVAGLALEFTGPGVVAAIAVSALVFTGIQGPVVVRAFALTWLVVPPGALMAYSFVQPAYHPRYVVHALPAVALLAAVGLDAAARAGAAILTRCRSEADTGRLASGCGFTLVACLLALQMPGQLVERGAGSRNDDQTAAARLIGAHAQRGDAMVFVPGTKRGVEYVYPRDFSKVSDVLLIETPTASGTLTGREAPVGEVRRLLIVHDRIWAIDRSGVAPDPTPAGRAKARVLRDEYRVVWAQSVTGLRVSLHVRNR